MSVESCNTAAPAPEDRRLALGIDLGTSGVKVVLVDTHGKVVGLAHAPYAVEAPHPSWAQSEPSAWIAASRSAIQEVLAGIDAGRVAGVGLDGQMHALLLLDADANPVWPAMLWPDSRARSQVERWQTLPQRARAVLANPIVPGMTGPLLCWLRDHEPRAYARGVALLAAKDYVRHHLVPGLWTDVTDASATLLWDIPSDRWATEVITGVGLNPGLLPAARKSDETAGVLMAAAAAAWGLPAGIPVAVGCSDVAATVLGAGVSAQRRTIIVGTGAQILQADVPRAAVAAPRFHTYCGVDCTYAMAAIQNAGLALAWVRRVLGGTWPELYATLRAGADAAAPLFLPHLSGERVPTPVPGARGAWLGLGLDTNREDLLRSAVEGVAFAIRDGLHVLPPVAEPLVDMVGGGARTPEFQQLLADVLGVPIRRIDVPEVTAVGAALLGWRVAGRPDIAPARGVNEVMEPRVAMAQTYDRLFERYRAAIRNLATQPPAAPGEYNGDSQGAAAIDRSPSSNMPTGTN